MSPAWWAVEKRMPAAINMYYDVFHMSDIQAVEREGLSGRKNNGKREDSGMVQLFFEDVDGEKEGQDLLPCS